MKEYKKVKRAAEAATKGMVRAIYDSLDSKEADNLCIELSMSLVTATLDFNEEYDTLASHLAELMASYMHCICVTVMKYKDDYDKGKTNEADTI